MTEEEAREALFKIHWEYMKHTPNERLELYDEYIENRKKIKKELSKLIMDKKEIESKIK